MKKHIYIRESTLPPPLVPFINDSKLATALNIVSILMFGIVLFY